ncbi:hypothetical protein U9M73_03060 [Paenibacillus phoenicis]|uniref:Signal transduction histidine kinase n=1 Tax=Paenibacillus phoenicis TaxID=554117 RepID=A0ABU5PGH3_9BACL|nr:MULTISPECIES: hypothetical protein [Paenibacillus]EES74815.1 hypothetical protein POTG_00046 [Paenibacillus sp. oral taxon 786 str. D14]MCT2194145.1 hypothetical protein [Paenibacillus sp. p3-SID1389]MEA3568975.1 hypothetical protein [Paenibacillus phoenicis]
MDTSNLLIFIICAFALGVVVILNKDRLEPRLRRSLALASVVLIALAFGLMIYSFLA